MRTSWLTASLLLSATLAIATETENLSFRALPAPAVVAIDGQAGDWDLSGGILTCSDVENQRDKFATWFHAQYDAENLYLLVRWIDETPLNNPGQVMADYGFAGDCLQFRVITAPDTPQARASHWTCWQGRDGNVMDLVYGKSFNEGSVKDAQTQGAKQAFAKNADGRGYAQELRIPWKILAKEGVTLKAGDRFTITIEPNFSIGLSGRLSLKDIFKPGAPPDRVFTFMANPCWGTATLEPKGKVAPQPVRLADGREFAVALQDGAPAVDWTGLIRSKELKGFKPIAFTLPEDGYVSLNLRNAEGAVVRQLLNAAFYTKGKHEVLWDGLTTLNWRTPGQPVPAGRYTWEALWHKGIGLRLVGWACNAGSAPWDSSPTANWGGDHGQPACCAADGERVYLGWSGAEAGKALLACDLQGNVVWKNSRAGMAGAELVAVADGILYAQHWGGQLYRLEAKTGAYSKWDGTDTCDLFVKSLWGAETNLPQRADAMSAFGGNLYLGFTAANLVAVLDARTGKLLKRIAVAAPRDVEAYATNRVYIVSEGAAVLSADAVTGETRPVVGGLKNAQALAVDAQGRLYVGEREPSNQVKIFGADSKPAGTIGRPGGRALLGPWTPDGMAFASGLAIDAQGKLWVAEGDAVPKRFSAWDPKTGALVKEFFGPTSYGALGGAIHPDDPRVMVGQGCEWQLDPVSGKAACVGVFTREGMENARFGQGPKGRTYVATATRWAFDLGRVNVYERLAPGRYKLRATFFHTDTNNVEIPPPAHGQTGAAARTALWSDANDDEQRQPGEIAYADGIRRMTGWYMFMNPDLTFYSGDGQYKVTGWTACGAPQYDLANPVKMPHGGLGSADGRLVLTQGDYNVNNGWNRCSDIASGKTVWTYPDNFVGVHGSHNAVPPEPGMIRGSFGPCAAVALPAPIGNAWVIASNVGEWHLLTGDGYYLARLFQPDPMKIQWPEAAVPGAALNNVPCGMGGEDFGGSATVAKDGKLYLQAGKTGFWNVEVTGLDTVKALKGGGVTVSAADTLEAERFRAGYLQEAAGVRRLKVARLTPAFTGDAAADFKGAEFVAYKKQDDAAVRTALARDDQFLYAAWEVKDNTPWVNGATEAAQLYVGGDTVDLQLAADPKADAARAEAVAGDLRLSIGSFQGQPTAVLYRKVSATKKPKVFSSGVVREYPMDYVDLVAGAKIEVKANPGKGYVVEAAIPLAALGITPASGTVLRGDIGATHGDPAGTRTRLRTYWSNQHSGIVDDVVFELQMEPKNWGELVFE